ncbi:phosphoserine phosphatase SerB [Altererythrobacter sp. RZ02]|uniref:Phosphoserine phosphatase n=1 Tax=Pontixanthobacter rizhaonensis TaxID=2730337 RepID=A0A848QP27_9SPHN|nr:phosphoserine phosphatase SerB [Pontixanthobacter rizhaonensis]
MSASGGLPLESGELFVLIARLIADVDEVKTRYRAVSEELALAGIKAGRLGFLELGEKVAQISAEGADRVAFREILERHFAAPVGMIADHEIDLPNLFISDMDSTMIEQECIDELADFAGLKEKVSAITERAMQGELDFEDALKERVSLLKGLPETAISECLEQRISPMPGARMLVQTLKSKGCQTVLVTGGFHHFADPVAEQLGFEHVVGNRLAVAGGKLTGEVEGPIVDSSTKLAVLREEQAKISDCTVLASGDGANDIPMLEAANYGIAYKAKPKARAAASGWIDEGSLTSVLELLGIPESDWVQ